MIYRESKIFLIPLLFSVTMILTLLLAACGKATPPPPPPPPPVATPEIEGKNLYTQKCAACHGPAGEGTQIGPVIAGHSVSAIKSQVRNPVGTMPAFPPAQLSDSELNKIAEFVASLGEVTAPVQDWEKETTETMHHWMALLAIKGDDAEDAKHHLQDALAFIKEPAKKAEMEKALDLIAQGKIHDAEHEIEEMAGAESPSGITRQRFHLILAQRGIEDESATEVKHHLDHFMVNATEAEKKIAREALELVEKGDFHEAEHEIEELLEM